jgi:hypothetical protein
MKLKIIVILLLVFPLLVSAKKKQEVYSQHAYGVQNTGTTLVIKVEKGKEHNHPLYAIWLTDEHGGFLETLYVSETIGKGVFPRANHSKGHWLAGEIQRPAALPYWAHQRNVVNEFGYYNPSPKHPEVDGLTGATPQASFVMALKTTTPLSGKYQIMLELNQSWDWNDYWYNDKFPGDKEYMTSSQPALVYAVLIDAQVSKRVYEMKPVGHSHYSGLDGSLNTDLSTLTTALKIVKKITVTIEAPRGLPRGISDF